MKAAIVPVSAVNGLGSCLQAKAWCNPDGAGNNFDADIARHEKAIADRRRLIEDLQGRRIEVRARRAKLGVRDVGVENGS